MISIGQKTLPPELLDKWRWSVIYSADWSPRDLVVEAMWPPDQRVRVDGKPKRIWQMTENNKSEIAFGADNEEPWTHRKWCALLSHSHFVQFLYHTDLAAEDVATMGSIGAPGQGLGCVPAFSFSCRGDSYEQNAYVTPDCDQEGIVLLLRWLRWQVSCPDTPWAEAVEALKLSIPDNIEISEDLIRKNLVALWKA